MEALHEGPSEVDNVAPGDTTSFTVLLAGSIHKDEMTLDEGPLRFGSTDSHLKNYIVTTETWCFNQRLEIVFTMRP